MGTLLLVSQAPPPNIIKRIGIDTTSRKTKQKPSPWDGLQESNQCAAFFGELSSGSSVSQTLRDSVIKYLTTVFMNLTNLDSSLIFCSKSEFVSRILFFENFLIFRYKKL